MSSSRPRFEGDIRVATRRRRSSTGADDLEHELVREALRVTGMPRGLDIVTLADVPSRGTGLGSSSAVTVGLLRAVRLPGRLQVVAELADEAARIEIEVLGKPIGRQDQYAAAFGGFNLIEFLPGRRRGARRAARLPAGTLERLHRSLLLFYTGRQRSATDVLQGQREAIQRAVRPQALAARCATSPTSCATARAGEARGRRAAAATATGSSSARRRRV